MARPDTWMPMYWRDFWADTGHLSPLEGWAYFNLIGAYWTQGGPLIADNARLQRWAKVSEKEWRTIKDTVTAFFDYSSEYLSHSRIDRELEKAKTAYEKRRAHIEKVNNDRAQKQQQSLSTTTETVTVTQPQPHSTNVEKSSDDDLPVKPKRARQVPENWQPNDKDFIHATSSGIPAEQITAIAQHFRDHHRAKGAKFKDISAAWRTWIANHQRFENRNRQGRSSPNRQGPSSVLSAAANVIAGFEADERLRGNGSGGMEEATTPEYAGGDSEILDGSEFGYGAAEPEGNGSPSDAPETPDQSAGRGLNGHGSDPENLHGGMPELPGGRGSTRAENAGECGEVLAGVDRNQTAVRPLHIVASKDDSGASKPPRGVTHTTAENQPRGVGRVDGEVPQQAEGYRSGAANGTNGSGTGGAEEEMGGRPDFPGIPDFLARSNNH